MSKQAWPWGSLKRECVRVLSLWTKIHSAWWQIFQLGSVTMTMRHFLICTEMTCHPTINNPVCVSTKRTPLFHIIHFFDTEERSFFLMDANCGSLKKISLCSRTFTLPLILFNSWGSLKYHANASPSGPHSDANKQLVQSDWQAR